MKKRILFLFACLLLVSLTACGGETATPEATPTEEESATSEAAETTSSNEADSLVVYFSATGNTEAVAWLLAETQGADLQEIVPAEPYTEDDLNYNDDLSRANSEQNDANSRPAIAGSMENVEQYDIVYVGFPIWWGNMPKILYTFFDTYDLTGKTIVPFCTSGSSGIEEAVRVIADMEPDATITEGLRTDTSQMATDVPAWLESIGLAQ